MLKDLKKLREQSGMTYQEVADRIGMSRAGYWQIEHGKTKSISYRTVFEIANVFGLNPDDIFLHSELTYAEQDA